MSRTFVCVHGIWHGGWCWSRVADILRARGHRISTPTQTGLGERAHLMSSDITLQTFVDDIVQHIRYEDLSEVVLVGHSFGGAPVTGAAEAVSDRIAELVYLDAIMLDNAETWFGLLPADIVADRTAKAMASSGGLSLPVAPPESFGLIRPEDIAFVESRLTPHPLATLTTPLTLARPMGAGLPARYIRCTEPAYGPAAIAMERAQSLGWPISDVPTGHDAMVSAPLAIADLLDQG
ncbi:MAG: alpha/beta hydrolase [Pseudomonadota bacterium]